MNTKILFFTLMSVVLGNNIANARIIGDENAHLKKTENFNALKYIENEVKTIVNDETLSNDEKKQQYHALIDQLSTEIGRNNVTDAIDSLQQIYIKELQSDNEIIPKNHIWIFLQNIVDTMIVPDPKDCQQNVDTEKPLPVKLMNEYADHLDKKLDTLGDNKSLSQDDIKKLIDAEKDKIAKKIGTNNLNSVVDILLKRYYESIVSENGTIDERIVSSFFRNVAKSRVGYDPKGCRNNVDTENAHLKITENIDDAKLARIADSLEYFVVILLCDETVSYTEKKKQYSAARYTLSKNIGPNNVNAAVQQLVEKYNKRSQANPKESPISYCQFHRSLRVHTPSM